MHKIRVRIGARDDMYKLDKFIEMDEGYFPTYQKQESNHGLISLPAKKMVKNVTAIVAVSITPLTNDESRQGPSNSIPHYIKINVLECIYEVDIAFEAEQMASKNAAVITDEKTGYSVLDNIAKKYKAVMVKDKTEVYKIFSWVHIAISNVKKKILELYHSVKDIYMKKYLNESYYNLIEEYMVKSYF